MKRKIVMLLLSVAFTATGVYGTEGDSWNAGTSEWSNINNPNGVWSYRSSAASSYGDLLDEPVGSLAGSPPAWVLVPGQVPGMFGDDWLGLPNQPNTEPNDFGGHPPFMLRWTAPDSNGDGTDYWIQITGTAYGIFDNNFGKHLALLEDNVQFADAELGPFGSRSQRFDFQNFSQGSPVLTRQISVGTTIDMNVDSGGFSAGSFRIEHIAAPAPVNLTVLVSVESGVGDPSGEVSPLPSASPHTFPLGSIVTLNADTFFDCPSNGTVLGFDRWEGDVADVNSSSTTITLAADKTVTVVYVDARQCNDLCHAPPALDLSVPPDCIVNEEDFAAFAAAWLEDTSPQ